jgi:hypothetical protein
MTTNPTRGKIPMPLFYARAYGPAILAGSKKNAGWNSTASNYISTKQTYSLTEISFTFKDPGMYTVEIVLESLFTPNIYTLPHTTDNHPYYGFLIPGFPLILNVTSSSHVPCNTAQTCNVSLCTSQDIQSDLDSSTGRWIVLGHTSRIIDKPFVLIEDTKIQDKGFQSYAEGPNRLSIETDYQPMNCVLAPLKSSMTLLDACMRDVGGIHFVLLGDSVTRLHVGALKQLLHPQHQVTLVSLRGKYHDFLDLLLIQSCVLCKHIFSLKQKGSITNTIDAASKQLLELKNENSTQPKVIVINAGIWGLEKFCLNGGAATFRAESNISNDDVESCGVYYRQNIQRVLDLVVKTFPSELKIFRPTQADFMKWGNFGFSWSPVQMQNIVRSPHVVKMFNDIAFQAIRESGYDVKIYDFFWMTWSRPDDTQIDKDNNAGKHMGHMGHDTLKVSLRKMFTLVADHFGCFRGQG